MKVLVIPNHLLILKKKNFDRSAYNNIIFYVQQMQLVVRYEWSEIDKAIARFYILHAGSKL